VTSQIHRSGTLPTGERRRAYLLGLLAFGAKAASSLFITWSVARAFDTGSFAVWATFFSFSALISVADLGAGQFILTTLFRKHRPVGAERALMSDGIALLSMTTAGAGLIAYLALASNDMMREVPWLGGLVLVTAVRLLFIPHLAYLAVLDRYHERKLTEAGSYVLGCGLILWGLANGWSLFALLVSLNVSLTAGAAAAAVRARWLQMPSFAPAMVSWGGIRSVAQESLPYFVNNLSGLAVYGGFVAIAATALHGTDLARIALLHNLVLMNLYQVFDLVFRSVQTRLDEVVVWQRLRQATLVGFVLMVSVIVARGETLVATFFPQYRFSTSELLAYAFFAFLEVYYLLLTTAIQMRTELRQALKRIAILKGVGFGAVIGVWQVIGERPSLLLFTLGMTVYAAILVSLAHWYHHVDVSVTPESPEANRLGGGPDYGVR